jgi:acyl-coenzyme A synthetase/AMP-(fatty) acid ligase
VAFIQPANMQIDLANLRQQILDVCQKNIAAYAIPQEIIFRETLPTTAFGKVNFRLLTEELNSRRSNDA